MFLTLILVVFNLLYPEPGGLDEETGLEFLPPSLASASAMTSEIVNASVNRLHTTYFRTLFLVIPSG